MAAQIAQFPQQMEGGVERARAHPVTVPNLFLADLRAVDRLLRRVIQDMQANKAIQEMSSDRIVWHSI